MDRIALTGMDGQDWMDSTSLPALAGHATLKLNADYIHDNKKWTSSQSTNNPILDSHFFYIPNSQVSIHCHYSREHGSGMDSPAGKIESASRHLPFEIPTQPRVFASLPHSITVPLSIP